jgi:CDP-2,3-bis-(O-geranylgeranyl)-sn-glycerol synthase
LFNRLIQLLYLMAPAYLANMTPPFTRFWHGWNPPISERWFGSHKTVVGVLGAIAVAVAATGAQAAVAWDASLVPYAHWAVVGLLLGAGSMGGDLAKSFVKRRLGIAPGQSWIPFDQLDFVLGALVLIAAWARLSWADIGAVLIVSFAADIVVNHVAHWLGIRETKW